MTHKDKQLIGQLLDCPADTPRRLRTFMDRGRKAATRLQALLAEKEQWERAVLAADCRRRRAEDKLRQIKAEWNGDEQWERTRPKPISESDMIRMDQIAKWK